MVRGNGAPAGLDPRAHFDWARVQAHPVDDLSAHVSPEVRRAIHYELTHDVEDIDEERRALARRWVDMARASKSLESEWLPDTPLPTRSVIRRLAVPMIRLLIDETGFPDEALNEDIVGFPLWTPFHLRATRVKTVVLSHGLLQ